MAVDLFRTKVGDARETMSPALCPARDSTLSTKAWPVLVTDAGDVASVAQARAADTKGDPEHGICF